LEDKLKVLFIGGTGIISSACVRLAVEQGIDLTLLNRSQTTHRKFDGLSIPVLKGDIRDKDSIHKLLKDMDFDVVVNWIAFTTEHIETDLEIFKGHTGQYIFISSASAYQTPPVSVPVTESALLRNPFWEYSRNKIACEDLLVEEYRQNGFPVTIVRPSHTYDATAIPMHGGYTILDRMMKGKKVIVHGDGTSLWTLTHHKDFAKGFNGLLGNPHAIGEAVHITSDETLTWNQIFDIFADVMDVKVNPVYMPSTLIDRFDPDWGAGLLGDKTHCMIFDNTKIKRLVPDFKAVIPFRKGAEEIVEWYKNNPSFQVIDEKLNNLLDIMISKYESIVPENI
jgi:nucleoside-diphosphate-sugar epimerase